MAPQELIGRYKEYKSKTKNVLHWLIQTASTCCDVATVVRSLASGSKKTNASGGAAACDSAELEIRTDELLELARRICDANPPVDVPEGILLIIEDVIAGRESCSEWYSAQALKGGSRQEGSMPHL